MPMGDMPEITCNTCFTTIAPQYQLDSHWVRNESILNLIQQAPKNPRSHVMGIQEFGVDKQVLCPREREMGKLIVCDYVCRIVCRLS